MHDLDHQLPRLNGTHQLFTARFFFNPGDKIFDHRQRHVGLKQGHPDFPHGFVDVLVVQHPAGGDPGKNAAQFVRQTFKHAHTYKLLHASVRTLADWRHSSECG